MGESEGAFYCFHISEAVFFFRPEVEGQLNHPNTMKRNREDTMFRKLYLAATVVLILVVMGAAITGCPEDTRVRYNVTLDSQTPLQAYAPLITVAHDKSVSLFSEGTAASADFADFVENDDLAGLVAALDNLDAVTSIYQAPSGLVASGMLTFSILAQPDDVLSIAAPAVGAMTDAFAGLDSVALPLGARVYNMDTFVIDDGDVELSVLGQNVVRVTVSRQ